MIEERRCSGGDWHHRPLNSSHIINFLWLLLSFSKVLLQQLPPHPQIPSSRKTQDNRRGKEVCDKGELQTKVLEERSCPSSHDSHRQTKLNYDSLLLVFICTLISNRVLVYWLAKNTFYNIIKFNISSSNHAHSLSLFPWNLTLLTVAVIKH